MTRVRPPAAWQIPISGQGRHAPALVAHWLHVTRRTDRIWPTACGRKMNPGFAISGRGLVKCIACKRRK